MPEYDIKFAKKLSEVAIELVAQGLETPDARRTVIYLSRLSMEISLKALLEKAGKPVTEIKRRKHDLSQLLLDVDGYDFELETSTGDFQWFSGTALRGLKVSYSIHLIDIETIIEAEKHGASIFPNEIRYGDNVKDVAPEILAPAASQLVCWALQAKRGVQCKP